MTDAETALRAQVARQVAHWEAAVVTLDDLDGFAAPAAWASLEHYLGAGVRAELRTSVDRLRRDAAVLRAELQAARNPSDLERVRERVVGFRRRFLRVETTLDFYGDAVNSRTNPRLSALLRACDVLATRSMEPVLVPLRRSVPPVLTYVDKGLGASILRAGLRLWDEDAMSPAAAIKITRHNLYRPTALIHETGHQVAHLLGWNEELRDALRTALAPHARDVADAWSSWASEVAADTYAFAHTGYAAVASLHDVVAGDRGAVFRWPPGDPHPVPWIRVLLNVAFCRRFYGAGPWDDLGSAWVAAHPLETAPPAVRGLLAGSARLLPLVVEACLERPARAFGGRPLRALVDPLRVRPDELARLCAAAGASLYTSPHWLGGEAVRLLALSGLQFATRPDRARETAEEFERWMLSLGGGLRAAA